MVYTYAMETSIQKWGNSLGVRLPLTLANKKALKAGSRVVVIETKTGLAIEIVKKPSLTLDSLVRGINKKNLHKEIDFGEAGGNEVW
jgi:antitoxin MazE